MNTHTHTHTHTRTHMHTHAHTNTHTHTHMHTHTHACTHTCMHVRMHTHTHTHTYIHTHHKHTHTTTHTHTHTRTRSRRDYLFLSNPHVILDIREDCGPNKVTFFSHSNTTRLQSGTIFLPIATIIQHFLKLVLVHLKKKKTISRWVTFVSMTATKI